MRFFLPLAALATLFGTGCSPAPTPPGSAAGPNASASQDTGHDSARPGDDTEVRANLAKLSPEDRKLAEVQGYCAIDNDNALGSMGTPVKVMVKGEPVFVCCKGCAKDAIADPDRTLVNVSRLKAKVAGAPAR